MELSGKPVEFSICKMMSSSKTDHLVSSFPIGSLLFLLFFLKKIYLFIYLLIKPSHYIFRAVVITLMG